jgi:DNA-binding transcriptional MerR regulator
VHLSSEPRFSEKELLELRQVTMQLSALGRNVNQIARALNVSLDHANQAHAVQWETMHKVIDLHRQFVKRLVKSNLDYWGMNDGEQ